jgi:hypothetical protein
MKNTSEYAAFSEALKTVVSVPREELKRREDEYQRGRPAKKKRRPKTSAADRASTDKD